MSKTKENPHIEFDLVQIEQAGFAMNLPEGFRPVASYQYRVSLESSINAERKRLVVLNRIDIRTDGDVPPVGHLLIKYYFGIEGLEHIKKNKKGDHIIPADIQLAVNSIALSTSRGILFAQFRGTQLHNALLPLIDPASFSVNEAG